MLKPIYLLLILIPLFMVSPLFAIAIGSADIAFVDVLKALMHVTDTQAERPFFERIIIELRLPRVILAMLCGAGLAVSGSVLQSVTRNPLADPYLFGISSGSTLGAVVALTMGLDGISLPTCAFAGALIAVAVVMVMSRDGQVEGLILAGVAISYLLSSMANLVLYFSDEQAIKSVLFWNMGSFSRATWSSLPLPAIIVVSAMIVVYQFQRPLQALMAGDESAHTQGVAVIPLRLGMLLLTALITASLVANCGGIGFVGLMVPHIVRMLIGAASRATLLATGLFGSILMVWVDLLSRKILPSQELPVGVVTSILGSVFFIAILIRRKGVKS
jgi:iron complex transport system permease protein